MPTRIEWCQRPGTIGETWNPIQDTRKGKVGRGYHCTKCSPGCLHCWAETMNQRFGNAQPFDDTPMEFEIVEKQYNRPLHWRKERTVFVESMGDLFHDRIPIALLEPVFEMIRATPYHTYQILTKRPTRMEFAWPALCQTFNGGKPLPNVWLGTTVCTPDETWKIGELLRIPAAKRFVSLEPLLSEIDLGFGPRESCHWCNGAGEWNTAQSGAGEWVECECTTRNKWLSWVICGAETGPGARPMDLDWARSIRDQCQAADVPFFFKSRGEWAKSTSWIAKGHGGGIASFEDIPDQPVRWKNHAYIGSDLYFRIGKHGNELDGRTWEEFPE